jgi:PAS domain S-box-containing protein
MFKLDQLLARKQAGNRIKFRILISLVLALGVLLVTFAFAIWRVQQKELAKAADLEAQQIEQRLHEAENQKTAVLKTTIEAVMNDGQLAEAFRKGDRAALLERAKPLFASLRREHGITHFYFHLPDRTVLLRVHDPGANGDKIDRHTMLEAERTGKVSVGIERGLTGIFTLRVVSPWRQDGQLLGYLELGVEFEKIVADIHNQLSEDVEFVVAVNKKFLDREQWVAAAKREGRTDDWNRFPRTVVINKIVETLPKLAVSYLSAENLNPRASWRGGNSQLVVLPLTDVTGQDLGKVLVLKNAAEQVAETSRSIQFVVVLSFAVGAVVIVFFYFFLTGVENDLSDRTAKLKNEIAERQGAERMLRQSEAQLQTVVENLDEGLVVSDLNGQLLQWNRAALKLHGYSDSNQDRRCFTELTDTFELSSLDGAPLSVKQWPLARILRGEKVHDLELRVRRVGSDWQRIFHYGGTLVHDANNQPLMAILTIRDITERKRVEQEIRQLNAELEERVTKRTAELEAANKELEAFSYSVSHDLRSPLRTLDGFSQAVLEDYGAQLPKEGRRYLQTIREGAQRMGVLIDDLLTFSRLSRLPLHKQTVETVRLVRDSLDELDSEKRGRKIDICLSELPSCHGDPALLKQVWVNLLSNALKYTRKREAATVEIGCAQDNGEAVYFVRDNGTGFDMKYAHKLFGVFQRLHRADEFEGTGVGLAIIQRIIHRHGGRIWAEAAVDRGATFHFTLERENNV